MPASAIDREVKAHAWAIFEVLGEEHAGSCANQKKVLHGKLGLNTDKD